MTNLERARNGERLKVNFDYSTLGFIGVDGREFLWDKNGKIQCLDWINQQIDYAVNHAIDDTKEPELWRDLEEGEVYQDGDRMLLAERKWIIIQKDNYLIGRNRKKGDCLTQRRERQR